MAQKKKVAKKVQRTQRPARASKKSLGIQVLILFILFQLVSLLTVQISGRGTAYLYMMLPLMIITYGGWLCVNRMHADVPFFLDTAMLLTFGTMIQCLLLKQDEMPTSLIVIYVLAAVAGVIAAIVYKHAPMIASAVGTSILMVLSVILYMATLLIGKAVGGGVRNWINIAGFSLQPSEFNKIIYVLVMAGLLCTKDKPGRKRVWYAIGFTLVNLGFLGIQGEFGTFLLILCTFLCMIFLFVPDIKVFASVTAIIAAAGAAAAACGMSLLKATGGKSDFGPMQFVPNQVQKIANRFIYWRDPAKDAQGAGYQILQGRKALLNSNLFGSSTTTPLSNPSNDMVFPALTERCGLIIAVMICIIFGLLLIRGSRIYYHCGDRYHQAVSAGLSLQLVIQAFIIIGGSTGMMPLTGITLPLISRGGSSLMATFINIAVILVISAGNLWNGRRDYTSYDSKLQKARTVHSKRISHLRNRNRGRSGMDNTR